MRHSPTLPDPQGDSDPDPGDPDPGPAPDLGQGGNVPMTDLADGGDDEYFPL